MTYSISLDRLHIVIDVYLKIWVFFRTRLVEPYEIAAKTNMNNVLGFIDTRVLIINLQQAVMRKQRTSYNFFWKSLGAFLC